MSLKRTTLIARMKNVRPAETVVVDRVLIQSTAMARRYQTGSRRRLPQFLTWNRSSVLST
jgi:hypothetical protein